MTKAFINISDWQSIMIVATYLNTKNHFHINYFIETNQKMNNSLALYCSFEEK